MPYLLTLAWIIAIIYATIPPFWLVIHPFAGHWRQTKVGARKLLGGTWLLIILATILATAPWREERLYTTPWAWLGWAILFVAGAAMYSRIGHFGFDNLIGRTELEPQLTQRLVTTGMHARLRHPIYLAHLLMLTAWAVGSGLTVAFALLVVALITGFFMIRAEDAELEHRFGDEYREYKCKVPALLLSFSSFLLALAVYQSAVYGLASLYEQAATGFAYFDPRIGFHFVAEEFFGIRGWPNLASWVLVAWLALQAMGLKRRWFSLWTYIFSEVLMAVLSIYFFCFAYAIHLDKFYGFSMRVLIIPAVVFSIFSVLPLLVASGQLRDRASKSAQT